MPEAPKSSVIAASFWMLLLSLLLFWLPGLGSLIAGLVGGKMAGGAGRGLLASILPSLLLGAALLAITQWLTGTMWMAALAGIGGFMIAVIGAGAMVIGALIGGLLA